MTNDKDHAAAVPTRVAVYSTLTFELFFTQLADGSVEIDLVFMDQSRRLGTIVHEGDPKKWMAYAAPGLISIEQAIVTTATGETLREVMDSIAAESFRGVRYTTHIPDEISVLNNPTPDLFARQWYVGFEEMEGVEMVTLKRGRIKLIIGTIKQTNDGYELELDEEFIDHRTPILTGLKAPEFDELGVRIQNVMGITRANARASSAPLQMAKEYKFDPTGEITAAVSRGRTAVGSPGAKEFANVAPPGYRYGFAKAINDSLPEVFFQVNVDKNVHVSIGTTPEDANLVCVIENRDGRYVAYPSTAAGIELQQEIMLIADPSYDQVKTQILGLIFKDVPYTTGHRPTEPSAIKTGRGGR